MTAEDPVALVRRLKADASPRDIWLCGGGWLATSLLGEIDRLVLKINPVLFGHGIRLFESATYQPLPFRLTTSRPFGSGILMAHYDRM